MKSLKTISTKRTITNVYCFWKRYCPITGRRRKEKRLVIIMPIVNMQWAIFMSASFRFKDLYDTYPFGQYSEESLYLYAVSLYELSPTQSIWIKAVRQVQLKPCSYL